MGGVHARAPCCELVATAFLTVPNDPAITDLYADPWLAPAARACPSAGRRFTGITILINGSLGSTIVPSRFAAVHRPYDSRFRLRLKHRAFEAARPQPAIGARAASSQSMDDGETRSVIGAEFSQEYDSLERRRRELRCRRCQRATCGQPERIAPAIVASSRRPRLRRGSAARALQQQQRKRQSDEDKDKSKKAKAAAAEQGAPQLRREKMRKTAMGAQRVQPRKMRAAAAAEVAAAEVAEAAGAADPNDTPCGSPMKWPRPWERPPPPGATRRTTTREPAMQLVATDGSQTAERPATLRTTTSHFHSTSTTT